MAHPFFKLNTPLEVPTFHPTLEEMADFSKYIIKIEQQNAHRAGLAKIVPPHGWVARKDGYDDIMNMKIVPTVQKFHGTEGVYVWRKGTRKPLTVREFQKQCDSKAYKPTVDPNSDMDEIYWNTLTERPVLYGADVEDSFFDEDCPFNLRNLNSCLQTICKHTKIDIPGVTSTYIYFGMWKSTFAWHTEDMDLYSINYLHFGAPKSWYVIPPKHGYAFERLASYLFTESSKKCPAFLRHKTSLISPKILEQFKIPCLKATQTKGDFMITFPYGYHAGYNNGFNCAEATNFAIPRWVEYGKRATLCECGNTNVPISMAPFVQIYQRDKFQDFLLGRDIGEHPETGRKVLAKEFRARRAPNEWHPSSTEEIEEPLKSKNKSTGVTNTHHGSR